MKKLIMKRNLLVLLLALMTSVPMLADVAINETNFPDEAFRNWLKTNTQDYRYGGMNGYGSDGTLTTAELNKIEILRFSSVAIENLKGIEYFSNLKTIHARFCKIKYADFSHNTKLQCIDLIQLTPRVESCNVSGCTQLKTLWFSYCSPISIDLSHNTELESLGLSDMPNYCSSSDDFQRTVDLSNNRKLKHLEICCAKQIDISNQTELISLQLMDCRFSSSNLDLSNNSELRYINLQYDDNLSSLTLPFEESNKIDYMHIERCNNLMSLDVSDCSGLLYLYYYGNGFNSVDISKNTALKWLYCPSNNMTELDVSNNTLLEILNCSGNKLKELDLSNNIALQGLNCSRNQLTELDLSHNTNLSSGNQLSLYGPVTDYKWFWLWSDYTLLYTSGSSVEPVVTTAINLSPQELDKDYISIDRRSKLGVQCNTNNGVLTSYGAYSAVTSSDDDNNYIVVGNGTTDVHAYRDTLRYSYNTGYTGSIDAAKTMEVNIGTSAHGMYVHPETLRGSDNFYSGTLYLEFPARIPDGVQCYYATALDDNEDLVGLTEVTGTIPANTAVIVKAPSEYKFFAFNESDETPDAPTDNIIQGTIEGLSVTPGTVLTLGHNVDRSTGEYDKFGFWNYRGSKISPFRAYIPKANLTAGAKSGFSLVFPEDNTTGIARLTYGDATENGTWYTLSGVRLNGKPTGKGIYVNNGKKIVIR